MDGGPAPQGPEAAADGSDASVALPLPGQSVPGAAATPLAHDVGPPASTDASPLLPPAAGPDASAAAAALPAPGPAASQPPALQLQPAPATTVGVSHAPAADAAAGHPEPLVAVPAMAAPPAPTPQVAPPLAAASAAAPTGGPAAPLPAAPGAAAPQQQQQPKLEPQPVPAPAPVPSAGAQQPLQPALDLSRDLSLPQLRQLFFDQPASPAALRQRHGELSALRGQLAFADGGQLWDDLLRHLSRYAALLEEREQRAQQAGAAPPADDPPFVPACDVCQQPSADGAPLQRMQVRRGRGWRAARAQHACRPHPAL